ncbi:BCL-6 corepressor-like protein 1 [Sinocyclocheilus anshuiensis]|uniref:BCL-6 corepressor-like protein 1 n=1 Tax=Sinocyclocheilus anshuiensis TaxID=1608454 RepID=UPI0007B7DC55|nr:PREDICTED: BCL-6 corepressor-like protein 1 [Sinocyclocheilus anshuiensis]
MSHTVSTLSSLPGATHPSSPGTAPLVLEINNVLSVLPVIATAILCVWAAHATVVSPEVAASAAEPPEVVVPTLLPESDLKSSPEKAPVPEFSPERAYVPKSSSVFAPAPDLSLVRPLAPEHSTKMTLVPESAPDFTPVLESVPESTPVPPEVETVCQSCYSR